MLHCSRNDVHSFNRGFHTGPWAEKAAMFPTAEVITMSPEKSGV